MVAMTAHRAARRRATRDPLGLEALGGRPLMIDDVDRLPDDGYRYELDEGVLVVSAAPATYHQLASSRLNVFLGNACPREMLVIAAAGVAVSQIQFRIPDLVVIRSDEVGPKFIDRPPLLAVEIASPSTRQYDLTRKQQVYAEFGIPDYWIITPDPDKPDIIAFELNGNRYEEAGHAAGDETFTAKRPFPVAFSPAALVSVG
jgi:Uma2 family endonuclease